MKREICKSWDRCERMSLSKNIFAPTIELSCKELESTLNENRLLISNFKNSIKNLKSNLTEERIYFFLTDRHGFLLVAESNEQIEKNPITSGIRSGMSFTEKSCGTNAISMAIHLQNPIYIAPEDHYCEIFKRWYCYAVPLFIEDRIVGYLDLSTINYKMKKELIAIGELLPYKLTQDYKNQMKSNTERNKSASLNLTKRQATILNLIAKGYTGQEIAAKLYISINTVNYHKKIIFNKLEIRSSKEAISKAFELNIFP